MAARELKAQAVARPSFAALLDEGGDEGGAAADTRPPCQLAFDLASHAPARDALAFALAMAPRGYNAFVLGEDGSGRMEATLAFLARHLEGRPPGDDWLYLNDFRHPHRLRPLALPAGQGRAFCARLRELLPHLAAALARAFASDACGEQVRAARHNSKAALAQAHGALRRQAEGHGLDVWQGPQGLSLVVNGGDGKPLSQDELAALPTVRRQAVEEALAKLAPALAAMRATARHAERDLARRIAAIRRQLGEETVSDLLGELTEEFGAHNGLARWLAELQDDILDHLDLFAPPGAQAGDRPAPLRRYHPHLLVDNGAARCPPAVLEGNPSVENLFGTARCHNDRTILHAGALHRAQGGVLVLWADDLWQRPTVWQRLKGALRAGAIPIEAAAPVAPDPIPLGAQLVLVGTPACYRAMLAGDPEFRAHIEVKAEILPHMAADAANAVCFARLLGGHARALGLAFRADGIASILGQACRWAGWRDRLSARFEHAAALLAEAAALAGGAPVGADEVAAAIAARRHRNGAAEREALQAVLEGTVNIASSGRELGRANGLARVRARDHTFGAPLAIAARPIATRHCGGRVAVERCAALAGSARRSDGAALKGWLHGLFARRLALAFSRPAALPPPGGAVVDDDAELAEACAILSALSGVALRQDLAIAGTVDRSGQAQAVEGIGHRVEGFFHLCQARGLSGSQGAIVPATSENRLVLRPEVTDAMAAGQFHLWAVTTVAEALELLADPAAGAGAEDMFARARAGLEAAGGPAGAPR